MRNQCMSLRDFNIEGKIMNKTYDTFFGRNLPKQTGDPGAVRGHDDIFVGDHF